MTNDEPDVWTGGLSLHVTSYDLNLCLKNEHMRFKKFATQKPSELLSFISSLGQTSLTKLHLLLDAKLEVILCNILLEKQRAYLLGDLSSTNKKL